jgi:hypothetical protein
MPARIRNGLLSVSTALIALCVVFCQSSEKIAPDGSTITLTATPATIVLSNGVQAAPVDILATVRSNLGLPLPGQDVRFSTTTGVLDPTGGTPVRTDDNGNALTILSVATQNATITATSGKATQSLTLNTATCNLSSIALDQSILDFATCTDTVTLTATATDTNGGACAGVLLTFNTATIDATTDVKIQASPGSKTTDAAGEAAFIVSLVANDCATKCQGGGNTCTGSVFVSAGTVRSGSILISDSVP